MISTGARLRIHSTARAKARICKGMTSRAACLVVLLLVSALRLIGNPPPPSHPTVLMAQYKGSAHPVIAVEKETPIILIDGKRTRVRGNVALSTERVPRYAGGTAGFSGLKVGGLNVVQTVSDHNALFAPSGPTVAGYVEFSSVVTASDELPDCFLALVAFDPGFLNGTVAQPQAQIRVRELGTLKAGQRTPVTFSTNPFSTPQARAVFVLLFSEGKEVRTNMTPVADMFFQSRERAVHAAVVAQWIAQHRGADQPVKPMLQIPPHFASTAGFPREISATLTVGADGRVTDVALSEPMPGAAENLLLRTLHGWLFLPKLEAGTPTVTRVAVPLQFKGDEQG